MRHYNTATKSVPANIIPPRASGKLCPTGAATELFVVEVEDGLGLDPVPVPVCPAAGEEVAWGVVPFVV
jgi:hypothetical protein